jgi:hypothetical protein
LYGETKNKNCSEETSVLTESVYRKLCFELSGDNVIKLPVCTASSSNLQKKKKDELIKIPKRNDVYQKAVRN